MKIILNLIIQKIISRITHVQKKNKKIKNISEAIGGDWLEIN